MLRLFTIGLAATMLVPGVGSAKTAPPPALARQPDLVRRSVRLFDVSRLRDWTGSPTSSLDEPLWLANDEAIVHSRMGDGYLERVYRVNIRTGRERPLQALSRHIQDYKGGRWQFSPDRRWILWLRHAGDHSFVFEATRTDGSRTVRWPAKRGVNGGSWFWLPGTHRWVNLWSSEGEHLGEHLSEARFYDLDRPRSVVARPLPRITENQFVGFLPSGKVLLANTYATAEAPRLPLAELNLGSARPTVRRYSVPVPSGGTVGDDDLRLSPDGRWLAWVVGDRADRPVRNGVPAPSTVGLWVSRADGRDAQAVGSVRLVGETGGLALHGWLPDGKRLVYEYDHWLYVVDSRYRTERRGGRRAERHGGRSLPDGGTGCNPPPGRWRRSATLQTARRAHRCATARGGRQVALGESGDKSPHSKDGAPGARWPPGTLLFLRPGDVWVTSGGALPKRVSAGGGSSGLAAGRSRAVCIGKDGNVYLLRGPRWTPERVTSGGRYVGTPCWGRDGASRLFVGRVREVGDDGLWQVDLPSRRAHRVIPPSDADLSICETTRLSPDGRTLCTGGVITGCLFLQVLDLATGRVARPARGRGIVGGTDFAWRDARTVLLGRLRFELEEKSDGGLWEYRPAAGSLTRSPVAARREVLQLVQGGKGGVWVGLAAANTHADWHDFAHEFILVDSRSRAQRRLTVPRPSRLCAALPGSRLLLLTRQPEGGNALETLDATTDSRARVGTGVGDAVWVPE